MECVAVDDEDDWELSFDIGLVDGWILSNAPKSSKKSKLFLDPLSSFGVEFLEESDEEFWEFSKFKFSRSLIKSFEPPEVDLEASVDDVAADVPVVIFPPGGGGSKIPPRPRPIVALGFDVAGFF